MKALKIIGATLGVIIALLLIIALFLPKSFRVERKIVINASPEAIFPEVNNFKNQERWSPWILADSTIVNTYSGPENGVGATSSWTSKKSNGTQTITESIPYSSIRAEIKLDNFDPMYGHFTFTPVEGGTEVMWADSGTMKYPFNLMGLLTDKMMGKDFETGLANLKTYVESKPKEDAAPAYRLSEYTVETTKPQAIVSVLDSCTADEIGPKLGELYGKIQGYLAANKTEPTGMPMAIYHSFSSQKVVLEAAFPVEKEMKGEGAVKGRTMPASKVLVVSHFGSYEAMKQSYPVIEEYLKTNKYEIIGPEFEVYMNDPANVKPEELETRIYFPIK